MVVEVQVNRSSGYEGAHSHYYLREESKAQENGLLSDGPKIG